MSNYLYFCTVKTYLRHEVAAQMQRFLCHLISIKNKYVVCYSVDEFKAAVREYLE